MDFKVISPFNLIQVNRDNRHSLYKLDADQQNSCHKLIPISFAQNQSFLKIDKPSRLILTADAVYSFDSLEHDLPALASVSGRNARIIKMQQLDDSLSSFLIVFEENNNSKIFSDDSFESYKELLLWNKRDVLLHKKCLDFCFTDNYFAVKTNSGWSVFNRNGRHLLKRITFPIDGKVTLSDYFVKFSNTCLRTLYSIKTGKLICKDKLLIENSQTENFAICATITDRKADVYYEGDWSTIENVEGFGIVADASHVFYVIRNGKYFLYVFCGEPLFSLDFPEGVDSVAYDDETSTLMVVNDSCAYFFRSK